MQQKEERKPNKNWIDENVILGLSGKT